MINVCSTYGLTSSMLATSQLHYDHLSAYYTHLFFKIESPRSGLLQASLVTLFAVYLTFSGISRAPLETGNSISLEDDYNGNQSLAFFEGFGWINANSGMQAHHWPLASEKSRTQNVIFPQKRTDLFTKNISCATWWNLEWRGLSARSQTFSQTNAYQCATLLWMEKLNAEMTSFGIARSDRVLSKNLKNAE